jgi:hypothetical protein
MYTSAELGNNGCIRGIGLRDGFPADLGPRYMRQHTLIPWTTSPAPAENVFGETQCTRMLTVTMKAILRAGNC